VKSEQSTTTCSAVILRREAASEKEITLLKSNCEILLEKKTGSKD